MSDMTPAHAWRDLREGNARFVTGQVLHPGQNAENRRSLVTEQHPKAALFGCADSRVPAEIIFDQGLGDLFVVRTAGHTVDASVIGSIEYAVEILGVPLIAVLGHDGCGAVKATVDALDNSAIPPGYIRDLVGQVTHSVSLARKDGLTETSDFIARHVTEVIELLIDRSRIISKHVDDGSLAVVGLTYQLVDGEVRALTSLEALE